MKIKSNIIVNINKAEVQTIHEIKLSKIKNLTIQELKSTSQRANIKVESIRNKYQDIILQINISLEKEKEKNKLIKEQQKYKKSLENTGSLNMTPKKISHSKSNNMAKSLSNLNSFSINMGHEMKNIAVSKSEVMEPGAHEARRKDENSCYLANMKRKNLVSTREEDKLSKSSSDSEE